MMAHLIDCGRRLDAVDDQLAFAVGEEVLDEVVGVELVEAERHAVGLPHGQHAHQVRVVVGAQHGDLLASQIARVVVGQQILAQRCAHRVQLGERVRAVLVVEKRGAIDTAAVAVASAANERLPMLFAHELLKSSSS